MGNNELDSESDSEFFVYSCPNTYLWACTFTYPGDSALNRYYSTWVIDNKGWWRGSAIPPHAKWYQSYKVIDEFSGIARNLILLDKWNEFSEMFYDVLTAALIKANQLDLEAESDRAKDQLEYLGRFIAEYLIDEDENRVKGDNDTENNSNVN